MDGVADGVAGVAADDGVADIVSTFVVRIRVTAAVDYIYIFYIYGYIVFMRGITSSCSRSFASMFFLIIFGFLGLDQMG